MNGALPRLAAAPRLPGRATGSALAVAVAIAALAIVPSAASSSARTTLTTLLIYAALAQAWNLVGGYAGQLSLGHSVFVGAGGYTTAMLLIETGTPIVVAVALSAVVGAGLALGMSLLLIRLREAYVAIGSLAIALAFLAWMVTWELTGGSRGLNIPLAELPGLDTIYYAALGSVVVASLVAWWLEHSSFGLRVMAVRDNESGARAVGVYGTAVKTIVMVMSGTLTAVLGAIVAFNQIALVPENFFGLQWSINMIIMTIIGGLGTMPGPLIGAGVVYYGIQKQLESQPEIAVTLTGALVIVVITLAPTGIWGSLQRLAGLAAGTFRARRA